MHGLLFAGIGFLAYSLCHSTVRFYFPFIFIHSQRDHFETDRINCSIGKKETFQREKMGREVEILKSWLIFFIVAGRPPARWTSDTFERHRVIQLIVWAES